MDSSPAFISALLSQIARLAPQATLTLGVLLGGLVLSALAKRVAGYAVRRSGLEALAEELGASKVLYRFGLREGITPVVQLLVWYGGVLITVASLAEILGLGAVQAGIGAMMAFLPRLCSGLVVLTGGCWVAGFLRGLLKSGATNDSALGAGPLPSILYFAIVTISVTLAMGQIGVEVGLVEALMQLAAGAAMLAFALAFALGGREVFGNLVARHYYQALLRPGDRIKLGSLDGTVVRVTSVAVVVSTADAEHIVPCSTLMASIPEIRRMARD